MPIFIFESIQFTNIYVIYVSRIVYGSTFISFMFDEGLILLETCKISDTSKVSAESQAAEIIRIALFTLLKVWIVQLQYNYRLYTYKD